MLKNSTKLSKKMMYLSQLELKELHEAKWENIFSEMNIMAIKRGTIFLKNYLETIENLNSTIKERLFKAYKIEKSFIDYSKVDAEIWQIVVNLYIETKKSIASKFLLNQMIGILKTSEKEKRSFM